MLKYASITCSLGVVAAEALRQNVFVERHLLAQADEEEADVVWDPATLVMDPFLYENGEEVYLGQEFNQAETNSQNPSSALQQVFEEIDGDYDGLVTPGEMLTWSTAMMHRLCGKLSDGVSYDLLNELVIGSPSKEQPTVVIDSQSAQILKNFESFQSKEVLKQMSTAEREKLSEKMASLKLSMTDMEIEKWIEQQAHLIQVFNDAKEDDEKQWSIKKKSHYELLSEELTQHYKVLELVDLNSDGVVSPSEWENALEMAGLSAQATKPDIEAFFISRSPDACFYDESEDEEEDMLAAPQVVPIARGAFGILRSMNEFYNFLDADANDQITPGDVGPAFEEMDNNFDNVISREELSFKIDETLKELCYEAAVLDRAGWRIRQQPEEDTKQDFFSRFDRNHDGELTNTEYRMIYRVMDPNLDGIVEKAEVAAWVQDNESGICSPFRDQIQATLDELAKQEKQALAVRREKKQFVALRDHRTLTAIYTFLDANRDKIINQSDIPKAFEKLDGDKNGELSLDELDKSTGKILYQLCYEGASSHHDEWLRAIDSTTTRHRDMWDILDFDKSGSLDITEYAQLYSVVDLDDDYVITRVELTAWFRGNEGTICRPFRDQIEEALDRTQLKSLSLFFNFLDADGDGNIAKPDVKVAFSALDSDQNKILDRKELSSVSDPIINQMCIENAHIDREKFLAKSNWRRSSKKDLFSLLDKNNNGILTRKEYVQIYKDIDTDNDNTVSKREAQAWVVNHLDTICRKQRPNIVKALLTKDQETALQLTSLLNLYNWFDADKNGEIKPNDVQPFFESIDANGNTKIDRDEFESAGGKIYYELCAEDAFNNPEEWARRTQPDENTREDLFALLDENDSGILVPSELKVMFRGLDLYKDATIERSEIVAWHRSNEKTICRPYKARIEAALFKLNEPGDDSAQKSQEEREKERRQALSRKLEKERNKRAKAEAERQKVEEERAKELTEEATERDRLAKEALELAKQELNEKERKRLAIEAQEKARRATEALERQHLDRERLERERNARQAAEKEVLAREQADRERLEREHRERDRLVAEQAERAKLAREAAEKARVARELALRKKLSQETEEREKLSREAAKQAKLAKEAAERERVAKEIQERARLAREQQERERIKKERAEREKLAKERAEKARLAREAREKERLAIKAAEKRRIASEKARQARDARARTEKLERERLRVQMEVDARRSAETITQMARIREVALAKLRSDRGQSEANLQDRARLERESIRLKSIAADKIREAKQARNIAKRLQGELAFSSPANRPQLEVQLSKSMQFAKVSIQEARLARDRSRNADIKLKQHDKSLQTLIEDRRRQEFRQQILIDRASQTKEELSKQNDIAVRLKRQKAIAKESERQARIAAEKARQARARSKNPGALAIDPPQTRAEFKAFAQEAFNVIDSDIDGAISFAQFKQLYSELNPNSLFKNASVNTWRRLYRIYDRNGDAKVTWPEAWKVLQYREQFVDEKPDTELKVSVNMLPAEFKKMCEELYATEDYNRDGLINFSEFKQLYIKVHPQSALERANESQWSQLFGLYDRNADSQVSWPEAWKYFSYRENFLNRSSRSIQSQLKTATEPVVTPNMPDAEFEQVTKQLFTRNDANRDGVINLAEFTPLYLKVHPGTRFGWASLNQWRDMYRLYDRNGDSKITWDEAWRLFKFREFTQGGDRPSITRPKSESTSDVQLQKMTPNQFKCFTAFKLEDKNKDQTINFSEFRPLYLNLNPQLPNQSYFQLVNLFNQYDQNRNGEVAWSEAWQIMKNIDCSEQSSPSISFQEPKITPEMSTQQFEQATKQLYKLNDVDSDGLINFQEFKRLYVKVHPLTPTRKANDNQWRALFNVYDMNKDGQLTWDESWRYFKFRERFNN